MVPRKRIPKERDVQFWQALGNTLRELRDGKFNQDNFADVVGVYRSHMGLIEQGKLDVRLSTLLSLAAALDMPLSELMRKVEEREQP